MVGKHRIQIRDNSVRYDFIDRHPRSIIFVDENFSYLKSEKFASYIKNADNYFVLITRAYLPMLAYSIKEVYIMHISGKYVTLNNEYKITVNELKNLYANAIQTLSKFLLESNINFDNCI